MFFLKGDTKQIDAQANALTEHGFTVQRIDIAAAIATSEQARALAIIWGRKLPGWLHYGVEFAECDVCTHDAFGVALEAFHPIGGRQ